MSLKLRPTRVFHTYFRLLLLATVILCQNNKHNGNPAKHTKDIQKGKSKQHNFSRNHKRKIFSFIRQSITEDQMTGFAKGINRI